MELAYREALTQTGLTKDQSAVYETLVKKGALPASDAAFAAGISRPLAYKILDELLETGLVEKDESRKVARFTPAHPLKLKEVVEKRLAQAQNAQTALTRVKDLVQNDKTSLDKINEDLKKLQEQIDVPVFVS